MFEIVFGFHLSALLMTKHNDLWETTLVLGLQSVRREIGVQRNGANCPITSLKDLNFIEIGKRRLGNTVNYA